MKTEDMFLELLKRAPCPACACTECLACKWLPFAGGIGGLRNDWSEGNKITSKSTVGDLIGKPLPVSDTGAKGEMK